MTGAWEYAGKIEAGFSNCVRVKGSLRATPQSTESLGSSITVDCCCGAPWHFSIDVEQHSENLWIYLDQCLFFISRNVWIFELFDISSLPWAHSQVFCYLTWTWQHFHQNRHPSSLKVKAHSTTTPDLCCIPCSCLPLYYHLSNNGKKEEKMFRSAVMSM